MIALCSPASRLRRKRPSERAMPKKSGLRIGLHLLAILLVGGLAMRASFAEEAGSSAHDDHNTSGAPAERGGSQPPSVEDETRGSAKLGSQPAFESDDSKAPKKEGTSKGTEAAAKNANTSVLDGKSPDANDTRITVQSRRLGNGLDKVGEAKGKVASTAMRNFHRRIFSTSRASTRTVRNAISVPIVPHESVERHDGEYPYSRSVVRNPAAGTPGGVGGATGGLAKTEDSLGRPTVPASNARPVIRSVVLSRGTIDGTGVTRPGVGPSRVGGPAKVVSGINGTTIRPKH